MANIPISALTGLTASTSTTILPVVENGSTYKIERDQFIPRAYATFYGLTDQPLTATTATTVNLTTSGSSSLDISLSANTITFTSGGTFLITASYQFSQGAGSADVAFWFKDGVGEIANSATHQTIGSNSKATSMSSIIHSFNAGETLQLRIQSSSSNTTIDNISASGSIPDAPAVILTINQIY